MIVGQAPGLRRALSPPDLLVLADTLLCGVASLRGTLSPVVGGFTKPPQAEGLPH
jgi:hypothetical protein